MESESVLRVMVVDDDLVVRNLFVDALSTAGMDVQSRGTALLALEAMSESKFDALVTDLAMPEMDGLRFVAKLRSLRIDTPAVLVSGFLSREVVLRALSLGVTKVLAKPASVEQLLKVVAEVAESGKAEPSG